MSLRIPQPWLELYPWLNDAVGVCVYLHELWHQYQGLVILFGLYLIARRLRHERILLSERVGTLSMLVKATRDETEGALIQPAAGSTSTLETQSKATSTPDFDGARNWEAIRLAWRDVRDRLELAIEGIHHRSTRGKYSRIPRYAYRDVINAMQKDGIVSAQVANQLRTMDTTFNILRFRPKTTTNADVAQFTTSLAFVDPHLPPLPEPTGRESLIAQGSAIAAQPAE